MEQRKLYYWVKQAVFSCWLVLQAYTRHRSEQLPGVYRNGEKQKNRFYLLFSVDWMKGTVYFIVSRIAHLDLIVVVRKKHCSSLCLRSVYVRAISCAFGEGFILGIFFSYCVQKEIASCKNLCFYVLKGSHISVMHSDVWAQFQPATSLLV